MRLNAFAKLALISAALTAGCALHHEPGIYELARNDAFARLQDADIGAFTDARGCGLPLEIGIQAQAPQSLRWIVKAKGAALASFTVRLESVGPSTTRAVVDFASDPTVTATLTTPSGAPALRQPLQGAVVEFVDAALNDRHFDASRTGDKRSFDEACTRQAIAPQQAHSESSAATIANWGAPAPGFAHANPWGLANAAGAGNDQPTLKVDQPVARGQEDNARDHPPPEG